MDFAFLLFPRRMICTPSQLCTDGTDLYRNVQPFAFPPASFHVIMY